MGDRVIAGAQRQTRVGAGFPCALGRDIGAGFPGGKNCKAGSGQNWSLGHFQLLAQRQITLIADIKVDIDRPGGRLDPLGHNHGVSLDAALHDNVAPSGQGGVEVEQIAPVFGGDQHVAPGNHVGSCQQTEVARVIRGDDQIGASRDDGLLVEHYFLRTGILIGKRTTVSDRAVAHLKGDHAGFGGDVFGRDKAVKAPVHAEQDVARHVHQADCRPYVIAAPGPNDQITPSLDFALVGQAGR